MAIDYTGANAGVFTRVGKLLKYLNSRLVTATTTYPAELKAIADLYEAADLTLQIEGLFSTYLGFQDGVTGQRQELAAYIDTTLTDRDTVIEQIGGLLTTDTASVMAALFDQMVRDAQTINRSTLALGSATPSTTNSGNGTFLVTRVLDGVTEPLRGGRAHLGYNGLNSELGLTESHTLTCTADSNRDNTPEGGEQFAWAGGLPTEQLGWQNEGSGDGGSVSIANGSTFIVTDGDFENWGGTGNNTPSSWTIVASGGTAGTHIFRESGASNVYRGTYSFKALGTGAQAIIGIEQTLSPLLFKARKRYCVGVRIKASSVPAAGQFEMHFAGTGYTKTAPTTEVQDIQISGTPSSGNYTISVVHPYGGTLTTANIAFNATSATVQAALRLKSGLEAVTVATQAGSPPNVTHRVTFTGVPGDIALATVDISGLSGGTPAQSVTQVTAGVEGDCVIVPAAAFPTTFSLVYFWINTPAIMPTDWKLVVQVTGTLSNTVALYWDSLHLSDVKYHGGVGVVGVAGSTRFIAGDRFTFGLTATEGVFQKIFRQRYRCQLPSSGSPTIADSLAT